MPNFSIKLIHLLILDRLIVID